MGVAAEVEFRAHRLLVVRCAQDYGERHKFKRILRSFSPNKYRYESDAAILDALNKSGYDYEIVERVPIWYFYCRGLLCMTLNFVWKFGGDDVFEWCDRFTGRIWPRYSGYYLVVRKKS